VSGRKTILLTLAALVVALLALPASAQPSFYFIHVPPHSSDTEQGDIDEGLSDIADILIEDWKNGEGNEGEPKVCWFGFNGEWEQGGPNQPNSSGQAANNLGNASSTDNQCGFAMPISYCAVDGILDEYTSEDSECDIVIGLGEGSPDGFCLEEHGGTGDPVPDCEGYTPDGPVCSGEGCGGTDWDEESNPEEGQECEPCELQDKVRCEYDGPVDIKPKDGGNAGNFLCGFFCCRGAEIPEEEEVPEETPEEGDRNEPPRTGTETDSTTGRLFFLDGG